MSSKRSKAFVIRDLLESGYEEDPENPLEKMGFTKLLQLRKDHAIKTLADKGEEVTDEIKALSKAEIQEKIDERTVKITPSLVGLFSYF
jgi:hypothetical protein